MFMEAIPVGFGSNNAEMDSPAKFRFLAEEVSTILAAVLNYVQSTLGVADM